MRVLEVREATLEGEYFHRHSVTFRLKAHRTRLFAATLADEMAKEDQEAAQYIEDTVAYFGENPSDEALIDKVLCDLHDIGIAESRAVIQKKLMQAELYADEAVF